jgi:hypothetical protein
MMKRQTIESHFDNGEEFQDVLDEAEAEARSGREREFVEQMAAAWKEYGLRAFMSEAQADWLRRISKT